MVRQNISLGAYTTFRIGGAARLFAEAHDLESLKELCAIDTPKVVLGRGSNVLVSDNGFDGLVIVMREDNVTLNAAGRFVACAGVGISRLASIFVEDGYSGLEWASGIPGTVGGACISNAGAFGGCIADVVESVEVLRGGKQITLLNRECGFSYRQSGFCEGDIILRATFCCANSDKDRLLSLQEQYALYRRSTQPKGFSAGSIFKRTNNCSAGYYIDKAGLKSLKSGGAKVSDKHANFIVNTGKAKASDVTTLIATIKSQVKHKFDIELEEEIKYIGNFD